MLFEMRADEFSDKFHFEFMFRVVVEVEDANANRKFSRTKIGGSFFFQGGELRQG